MHSSTYSVPIQLYKPAALQMLTRKYCRIFTKVNLYKHSVSLGSRFTLEIIIPMPYLNIERLRRRKR